MNMLKEYKRLYEKIDVLVKQEVLVQLKRGLSISDTKLDMAPPETVLIANHLYKANYISLDKALSYWDIILPSNHIIPFIFNENSIT